MPKLTKHGTPWADLLPPLSTTEFAALEASIQADGVREAVVVDEDGNVLDGHHRLKIDPKAPTRVLAGLTEAEKRAFVFQSNFTRRNLSPSQKKAADKSRKKTANALRAEDPKKNTQARVAMLLGVARRTVGSWWGASNGKNAKAGMDTPVPDARVKIPPKSRAVVAERVEKGEAQAQVAADYGVTRQAVSAIVTKERKQREAKAKRAGAVAKAEVVGVHLCALDRAADLVEPASVDLIFTDPPYDKAAVPLYGQLGSLAMHALRPGGWCLAYSGQTHLPEVIRQLGEHLKYGWCFAIGHSGGDQRIRNLHLHSKWKPIVGFYKPPLGAWWDWFADFASGGREKADHEWQQALSEAVHFVDALCPKGGLVLDPMCGSGTTLLAAKQTRRQWIGSDVDEDAIVTTTGRLA